MPSLPSGTVTFAFSDIEGSTAFLKRLGDADYATLLATHRSLVRETFAGFGGHEIDTQGDAFFYSFGRAREAVAAAVAVTRAHAEAKWPQGVAVRVRIGLHTGEPAVGDEGYTGLDVVRASRIAATGKGAQVLLSDTTRAIVADDLPEGVTLRPLGERRLRDIDRPEPISELVIAGLETDSEASRAAPASPADPRDDEAFPGASEVPSWVRDAALRLLPGSGPARDLIEERVLGALDEAFTRSDAKRAARDQRRVDRHARRHGGAPPESGERSSPPSSSVADEIERLRALRDAGALTEEQYARAVDRVLAGD